MKFSSKIATASLILCLLNGCFYERPFAYPVQIRQQGNTPCFAIESSHKTRRSPHAVIGISVYGYNSISDPQKGAAQEVWTHHYFYDEPPHNVTSYFITPANAFFITMMAKLLRWKQGRNMKYLSALPLKRWGVESVVSIIAISV